MSLSSSQSKPFSRWTTGRVALVAVLFGGIAFAAGAATHLRGAANTVPDNVVQSLRQTGQAFTAIDQATSPAVVSIRVEKMISSPGGQSFSSGDPSGPFSDEFFRRFFGDEFGRLQPQPRQSPGETPRSQGRVVMGQGSGYIVTSDGYVVTNHHVVEDADKVIVRLSDGREFTAKVVGSDSHTDVAVLDIEATGLPTLQFGDSDKLQVGEWVLASGAPFGLTHTLTAGIVSAKGRSSIGIADYENFIQTDAAINPGNSGGPLLNLNGHVVGMNTAIFSKSGGSMGVGFAIPSNMVNQVYEQILKSGAVTRAYLGVIIQPLTPELAETFGVKGTQGALVSEVREGTPGAKAGLKQGDVVTAINGKKYDDIGRFRNAIALMPSGTKVELTVLRDGKTLTLTATLEELPGKDELAATDSGTVSGWGFTAQTVTSDIAKELNLPTDSGVVIVEVKPGSIADRAGLKPGMLIRQVNRKSVSSLVEMRKAIEASDDADSLLILVQDERGSRFVVLRKE